MRFSVVPDRTSYAADGMAAEDVFEIDEVSGTVRVRAPLDYERKQGLYSTHFPKKLHENISKDFLKMFMSREAAISL